MSGPKMYIPVRVHYIYTSKLCVFVFDFRILYKLQQGQTYCLILFVLTIFILIYIQNIKLILQVLIIQISYFLNKKGRVLFISQSEPWKNVRYLEKQVSIQVD
jgi:hypothetical protein